MAHHFAVTCGSHIARHTLLSGDCFSTTSVLELQTVNPLCSPVSQLMDVIGDYCSDLNIT